MLSRDCHDGARTWISARRLKKPPLSWQITNTVLIKDLTYLGKVKHESSHPVAGNVVVLLGLAQFGHVVWLLVHKHGVLVCIVMSADSVVGNL